jgi:hypothetical protein
MNHKLFAISTALLISLLALLGCSENSTYLQSESLSDQNWGRSYETQKYNQMVDPDAGKNPEPVVNMDGVASENNVQKYRDSFKEGGEQETVNVLKLQ